MTTATDDRPSTAANETRLPINPVSAMAVVVASIGVFWPGGLIPVADRFFFLIALAVILSAVIRHPGVKGLVDTAPTAAKRAAAVLLGAFLIGQLWGVSAQTFPVAAWTMYANNPGPEAVVYRFDALTADGEPVEFTPSASNRTLTAKIALVVHLRQLSDQVYQSAMASDAEQLAVDEDALRRAITTYVELHNAKSSGVPPASVEVSRVTYDITEGEVTVDSGDRHVLLQVDLVYSEPEPQ